MIHRGDNDIAATCRELRWCIDASRVAVTGSREIIKRANAQLRRSHSTLSLGVEPVELMEGEK